jgi:hypothetical protein
VLPLDFFQPESGLDADGGLFGHWKLCDSRDRKLDELGGNPRRARRREGRLTGHLPAANPIRSHLRLRNPPKDQVEDHQDPHILLGEVCG